MKTLPASQTVLCPPLRRSADRQRGPPACAFEANRQPGPRPPHPGLQKPRAARAPSACADALRAGPSPPPGEKRPLEGSIAQQSQKRNQIFFKRANSPSFLTIGRRFLYKNALFPPRPPRAGRPRHSKSAFSETMRRRTSGSMMASSRSLRCSTPSLCRESIAR